MQKPEIWRLVLAHLVPTKTDITLGDWRAYINRCIVPEVRQESTRFFGSTDCIESQNPGLDYANPAHRRRLYPFPHHNQLFTVFDKLRLTGSEIHTLCKWHGTRKAKEEFEKKHCVKITDTTWDGVDAYRCIEPTVTLHDVDGPSMESRFVDGYHVVYEEEDEEMGDSEEYEEQNVEDEVGQPGEESEDELQQSVGVELNERLMASAEANAEARARGETVTMDPEWEQWLKEAAERGVMPGLPQGTNNTSIQWAREIPDAFTSNTRPDVAALQARLPPIQPFMSQVRSTSSGNSTIIQPSDLIQPATATSAPAVES